WNAETGQPRNLLSGKDYRGINVWLLNSAGYTSPFWATFNQVKEKGGNVKKSEKSQIVIFWKTYEDADRETGENQTRFVLRYFNVFNSAQCEGIEVPVIEETVREHTPIEICEKIVG